MLAGRRVKPGKIAVFGHRHPFFGIFLGLAHVSDGSARHSDGSERPADGSVRAADGSAGNFDDSKSSADATQRREVFDPWRTVTDSGAWSDPATIIVP